MPRDRALLPAGQRLHIAIWKITVIARSTHINHFFGQYIFIPDISWFVELRLSEIWLYHQSFRHTFFCSIPVIFCQIRTILNGSSHGNPLVERARSAQRGFAPMPFPAVSGQMISETTWWSILQFKKSDMYMCTHIYIYIIFYTYTYV